MLNLRNSISIFEACPQDNFFSYKVSRRQLVILPTIIPIQILHTVFPQNNNTCWLGNNLIFFSPKKVAIISKYCSLEDVPQDRAIINKSQRLGISPAAQKWFRLSLSRRQRARKQDSFGLWLAHARSKPFKMAKNLGSKPTNQNIGPDEVYMPSSL